MSKQFDILIIDDEQVIIDSVVKIAQLEDLKADYSYDAEEALKKIGQNTYRLIICDIMMPEVDGFQFLDEIASRGIKTPLVMTTGYSTVENAVKSLYQGAIAFLPKPFTVDEMTSMIFRGVKYTDILENKEQDTMPFVPCPSKYLRLGYSCWIYEEKEGTVLAGATDLFYKTIDEIENIELLENNTELSQGMSAGVINTKDELAHNIPAAISGKIIERNENLLENLTILEKDPYFKGWLYRIIPSDFEYDKKYLVSCSSDL